MLQSDTNESLLKEIIPEICKKNNIDCTNYFLEKVRQIYETMLFRPGVMIIGDSFSGKTTAYRVLAEALNHLNKKTNKEDEPDTSFSVINPKSLTLGEFYGEFEKVTHEWHDGILANNFRAHCNSTASNRKWLIFDGPIDSIWMENMNSVLDDNRKLCLMSGDILYLTPTMSLFFEASHLENASPSIVGVALVINESYVSKKNGDILFIGFEMRCSLHAILYTRLATIVEFVEKYFTSHSTRVSQGRDN